MSKTKYKIGDVVWAKKSGQLWWPAVIDSLSLHKEKTRATAHVNFIGKKAHLHLPLASLKHFKEMNEDNLRNNPKLRAAVFAARRIYAGTSTFEAEKKQWEGAEDIHVAKKRAKKEPAQMPKPTQEPPSKAKKDEEIKLPTHKDVKEEAKVMVPDLPSYKKIQPHEVIPLLRGTLSKILEHKDPNKVSSADLKVIEGCLEQTILQEVPVQVLIDSKVGILVKEFYDFVHKNPQLKMLDIIARCAFKKLKKRVCEMLFGITKTLQYIPKEQPVETVEIISSVERSSPLRIKRKDKMEQKEEQRVKREMPDAQRWYMLRTRDVAPKMSQSEVEENIHKPPVNPRLASRVIEKLAKLLQDKRFKGKNEAKEIAKNIEWYMRIFDTTMGTTYKRWVEKIENLLRTWKGKPDGALVIDRIHEILPIAPPDVKVPF